MYKGKVTIITGASSGIGKACALEFARLGSHVVLASRGKEKLLQVAETCKGFGVKTLCVVADVAKEDDCHRIIKETVEHFGKIDILINNAGVSMRALLKDVDLDVLRRVMDVNYWGTVYCTKFALPYILQSQGSIIGVISVAGFRGLPGRTAYSASKFAINGFLEVLRTEHLKDNLHVLLAAPGFTASNIRVTALTADGSEQGQSPRDELKMMSPERVAKRIARATQKRKRYLIMSCFDKLTVLVNKLFPGFADRMTYRHMAKETDSPFK